MGQDFYQAVYAHPDTGWAVINTSENMPQTLKDDFSAVERGNAGAASGTPVPMGKNETPSCMYEIYFRNDAVGLVRVQYNLSDGQGRPVSFAHGYIFPDAYTLLKKPDDLLRVKKENFADQRIKGEERALIRATPGAFNRELIERSKAKDKPQELLMEEPFSLEGALEVCGISEDAYRTYILAIYAHILSTNTDTNLYIKTDGSEKYAWNLLYLTYSAIPYSMRTLLSASTYLHIEQHNTKLIFCAELPGNMPQIDPVSGSNNVMGSTVEKRMKDRNPFIVNAIDCALAGKQDQFFIAIRDCLRLMGNEKLNTMQAVNLAYSFLEKEYDNMERLPGFIYGWGALPVANSEYWEKVMCNLLKKAEDKSVTLSAETRDMLSSRLEKAVTDDFKNRVGAYLASSGERKWTDG